MKKCIVISDSFKGTLSSLEICDIARRSVPAFFPDCQVLTVPVADGGEGTVACFRQAIGAVPVTVTVSGPYGQPVRAVYARAGHLAVIEMAAAAGLPMVGDRKNPELTTTYGVGEMIRHAVEHGCTELLLGLGGSATNDGGCGCAAALGAVFSDEQGSAFVPVGQTLSKISSIQLSPLRALLRGVKITAMCDVDCPLFGPQGAAHVFAPQKGADEAMVLRLDQGLVSLSRVIEQQLDCRAAQIPGAGAAGGFGAGCVAFLGAELRSGIECILDAVSFDRMLDGASLVITGEGRIDSQSLHGKVISGVARRTAPRQIPLLAIVGSIDESAAEAYQYGVTAMFGIDREALPLSQFAHRSRQCYQRTLEDVLRLIRAVEAGGF